MRAPSETAILAVTVALVEFVHAALLFVLLPTLVSHRMGWGIATTGAAVSTYFFAEVACKLLSGWLVDHLGARRMLLIGFWLYAAAFAGLVLSRTTWEAFLALVLMGAGASPLWPAALTRLTRSAGQGVGGALGQIFSTWFLGAGVGIGFATLLSRTNHPVSLGSFLIPLLGAGALSFLLPRDVERHPEGRRPAVGAMLRLMIQSVSKLATSLIPQIIAAGVLIPIVVPYLEIERGLDERELLVLMILGMGTGLALLAPAGRIGDRVGRRRTYGIGLGAVALLMFAVPFCRPFWALALNFVCMGVGYAFVLPAWNSILLRLLPEGVRGAGLGVLMTIEGLGGVIGPLLGGLIAQWLTLSYPFYLSGSLLLLASGASTQWRAEAVEG